jgi:SIR2-like domain
MDQARLVQLLSESASQISWLLGAGASQSAGLPTAWDVMWDLKRLHYNLKENQQISPNDVQNPAVREKIEAYMEAQGFLPAGDPREYSACFELIFGDDYDRQSKYLRTILSGDGISLSVGHRALAAMMASGQARAVFTTNFDTVVETAFAAVSGKDIAAFHLEGSYAANAAMNNDEFPIYVKLHGDFRYQSTKNLSADLSTQDKELGKCLVSAGNRFGLVVAGYSGRDESVMALIEEALGGPNPFPHGLFWTTMKGRRPFKTVEDLIAKARARGVKADIVEIETFDSLMSRVWRQLPSR